ncbi:AtpZ/AtpI family protein [Guyparkeria sp. GHLCS8-2]|uniref:AtpZ/AtpI family protein n=1 Tax=Guyparkeria halopsychrophila TaxID=3139421 RepID=UPI0037C7E8E7
MTDKRDRDHQENRNHENRNHGNAFSRTVGVKAVRKLTAQRDTTHGVWFGLGMMGLVGWSVAVPTLLGTMLGLWLDEHHPAPFSWTLALLVAGLVLGCLNAWRWVAKEDKAIQQTRANGDGGDGDE